MVSSAVWPGWQLLSFTATAAQKLPKPVCKAIELHARHSSLAQAEARGALLLASPHPVRVNSPSLSSCIQAAVPRDPSSVKQRAQVSAPTGPVLSQLLLPRGTHVSKRSKPSSGLCRSLWLLYCCCDQLKRGRVTLGHSSVWHIVVGRS